MRRLQKTFGGRPSRAASRDAKHPQDSQAARTALWRLFLLCLHAQDFSRPGEGRTMTILAVGRLCVKLAGRDAGRKAVIVDDSTYPLVLLDGDVRRKKVNVKHLEPLDQMVELKQGATHSDVKKAFESLGLPVWETKPKEKKERLRKQKKVKVAEPADKKAKKEKKKEEKKKEVQEKSGEAVVEEQA